jgi:hypothetical protein
MTLPTGIRPDSTTTVFLPGWGIFPIRYEKKRVAWQKAPYNLPLGYYLRSGIADIGGDPVTVLGSPRHDALTICEAYTTKFDIDAVWAKAYEKLRGRIYSSASLGVDFAEYRQSLQMLERSVDTLVRFTRAVRRLDFLTAAAILRGHVVPPKVNRRRAWASNWLEYHFGWEPLVRDIYDSIEVLHNPIKSFTATKGTAFDMKAGSYRDDNGSVIDSGRWVCYLRCKQGATVRSIQSGTLHSLEQFGLLNPLSIAWELVPFSFVVDWFVNVGDVLRSYSDFAGMTLEKQYRTRIFETWERGEINPDVGFSGIPRKYSSYGLAIDRATSIFGPTLSVKSMRLPSKERALTAVSLLVQQFGKR